MRSLMPRQNYFYLAGSLCLILLLLVLYSSRGKASSRSANMQPLPQGVVYVDRTVRSSALGRSVRYRMILPRSMPARVPLHVLYLLHGNGSGYREWSESSPIAQLAAQGYVLVMPEGHSTYFMNSASQPADRYEDYLTQDLIHDAEKELPVAPDRAHRAIVGVSMGGFAAIVLGLKHPALYSFAGALSPPIDFPERRFTLRRISQSLGIRRIFGPAGSPTRAAGDPFVLARQADLKQMPYLFLSVGQQEGLAEPVGRFDRLLTRQGIAHEFHQLPGGHDWAQWNHQLPTLQSALLRHSEP